jgi:hypothetical protein
MNSSGARRRQAASELAREFRVATRHKRRSFLMTNLNKAQLLFFLPFADCLYQSVDSVAGDAENYFNPPVHNGIDQDFRCGWHS